MAKQGRLYNTECSLQASGSKVTLTAPKLSRPGHVARMGDSRIPKELLALEGAWEKHLQSDAQGNRIQDSSWRRLHLAWEAGSGTVWWEEVKRTVESLPATLYSPFSYI